MVVNVSEALEANRYEARVEGESTVAGFAQYIRTAELVAFVHTEVSPAYEGRGAGAALARAALDADPGDGARLDSEAAGAGEAGAAGPP
jgi:uncharacterized protein